AIRERFRQPHKSKTFSERKSKSPKPSSGDCVNRRAHVPLSGVGSQVDNRWQHRLKREHPTCTERIKSLIEECGWKGGDSGGDSVEKKPCPTKERQNQLDSDRPSHGRRLHSLTPSRNRSWCYGDFS